MRRVISGAFLALALTLAGCNLGPGASRTPTASGALTSTPELLEFETPQTRQDLFRELSRASLAQAGKEATGPVYFPIVQNDGKVIAAPGFDTRADLFQAPDSGQPLALTFESRGDRWNEVRSDSLQGLSEREAVELVARTLLTQWDVKPSGTVQVDRASGAPYAVAYVQGPSVPGQSDIGILRVNPAFLYMAASALQ